MNACGVMDTTWEELVALASSRLGAVVMKTATIRPREGNPTPRYARFKYGSIQAMGLPNLGYKAYIKFSEELKKFGKPVIASVFGFNLDEYEFLVSEFQKSEVSAIEVNVSCPNAGEGIPAYNTKYLDEVLSRVTSIGDKPIGLKLPPYLTEKDVKEVSSIIKKYNVSYITLVNSYPTGLVIGEDEKPLIVPRNGFGGIGGESLKPIALANVAMFGKSMKDVYIAGVGGISSGKDVLDFFLAGADVVQLGTVLKENGLSAISEIEREFMDLLRGRSIEEIKGKALG